MFFIIVVVVIITITIIIIIIMYRWVTNQNEQPALSVRARLWLSHAANAASMLHGIDSTNGILLKGWHKLIRKILILCFDQVEI